MLLDEGVPAAVIDLFLVSNPRHFLEHAGQPIDD